MIFGEIEPGTWVKIQQVTLHRSGPEDLGTVQKSILCRQVFCSNGAFSSVVHMGDGVLRAYAHDELLEVMAEGWQPDYTLILAIEKWFAERNAAIRKLREAWDADLETMVYIYGDWQHFKKMGLAIWERQHPRPASQGV
ncbi:MAG TPA: hypothetical protein VKX46_20935 [Ktedonobacteraceae bacterium]|jgi:hypothetical protein|nr:hypothetical protein [Ktedonobacteraceae bacterium]